MIRLYGYWRSSCTWRVRIGLNLKGVPFEVHPVNLLHAEQRKPPHSERNPMAQVPVLSVEIAGQRHVLRQSLAILEYIEEAFDGPALLPADPLARQRTRALAEIVNSGIQPLQNLSVLSAIEGIGGDRVTWSARFIDSGLRALEASATGSGPYLMGDSPTLADACLIPQLYNARRFGMNADAYPRLVAIEAACQALPAFQKSHPDLQPDAIGDVG